MSENMGAGAGYPAGSDHRDGRADIADQIVDRVARFDMAAGGIQENADGVMIDMVEIEELRRYAFGQFLVNAAENHDRARFQKFCHHGTRQAARLVLVVIVLIV